jgi:hypothetical protein
MMIMINSASAMHYDDSYDDYDYYASAEVGEAGESGCDASHADLMEGNDRCCQPDNQCTLNEGDCDTDYDCISGLMCGVNNCEWGDGYGSYDDCCVYPYYSYSDSNVYLTIFLVFILPSLICVTLCWAGCRWCSRRPDVHIEPHQDQLPEQPERAATLWEMPAPAASGSSGRPNARASVFYSYVHTRLLYPFPTSARAPFHTSHPILTYVVR